MARARHEAGRRLPLSLEALHAQIRACRRCAFAHAPRPVVEADAGARILVVGQAPGKTEEREGRPWQGPAGKRLTGWMVDHVGFADAEAFRSQVAFSAIARCFPGPGPRGKGDAKPSPATVANCAPHLDAEIALLRPRVVVAVGRMAIDRFLRPGPLDELVGQVLPVGDMLVAPLPHPSGASTWLNHPAHQARLAEGLKRLRQALLVEGLARLEPRG